MNIIIILIGVLQGEDIGMLQQVTHDYDLFNILEKFILVK